MKFVSCWKYEPIKNSLLLFIEIGNVAFSQTIIRAWVCLSFVVFKYKSPVLLLLIILEERGQEGCKSLSKICSTVLWKAAKNIYLKLPRSR